MYNRMVACLYIYSFGLSDGEKLETERQESRDRRKFMP